jgi:3-keto-5-aminohexanoate cleavage enzyme
MQKLVVTVTCDSTMSYPSNPHNPTPRGIDAVAEEYVRAIDAGASICHLHGPYSVDAEIQADGTKLSNLDIPGWKRLRDGITGKRDAIIQYGIANGRFPQRKQLMAEQRPDMISRPASTPMTNVSITSPAASRPNYMVCTAATNSGNIAR